MDNNDNKTTIRFNRFITNLFCSFGFALLLAGLLSDAWQTINQTNTKTKIFVDPETGCEYLTRAGVMQARSDDWGMQRGCRALQEAAEVTYE